MRRRASEHNPAIGRGSIRVPTDVARRVSVSNPDLIRMRPLISCARRCVCSRHWTSELVATYKVGYPPLPQARWRRWSTRPKQMAAVVCPPAAESIAYFGMRITQLRRRVAWPPSGFIARFCLDTRNLCRNTANVDRRQRDAA